MDDPRDTKFAAGGRAVPGPWSSVANVSAGEIEGGGRLESVLASQSEEVEEIKVGLSERGTCLLGRPMVGQEQAGRFHTVRGNGNAPCDSWG